MIVRKHFKLEISISSFKLFFETLKKQPCMWRIGLVLNGQMRVCTKVNRVIQKTVLLENRVSKGLNVFPDCKSKKQTNLFAWFLRESMARQSAYGII